MNTNRYSHRVQVQKATETQDAQGGISQSWATAISRWASIEPLRGREHWSAAQVQSDVTHRIKMVWWPGWRKDLRTDSRIICNGRSGARTFNIESVVDEHERHNEVQVLAVEDTSNG